MITINNPGGACQPFRHDNAYAGRLSTATGGGHLGFAGGNLSLGSLDVSSHIRSDIDFVWPEVPTARDLLLLQRKTVANLLGITVATTVIWDMTATEIGKIFEYRFLPPVVGPDADIDGMNLRSLVGFAGQVVLYSVDEVYQ